MSIFGGMGSVLSLPAGRSMAHSATPTATPAPDLERFFPDQHELPAGLELESTGTREEIAQLAGTFRNSRDAAQLLAGWGWVGNAYRSYAASVAAGSTSPARVEISLHQFTSSTGAAYALSYFAHDRAVALQRHEGITGLLLPCEAMVTGDGSATRFLRRGNLVVRVTVVMPRPVRTDAVLMALTMATEIALVVLTNPGDLETAGSAVC